MADTLVLKYGRTSNVENFENIYIEVEEPLVHQTPEQAQKIAAYRVLIMAHDTISRIRQARTQVSPALGPLPQIELEIKQLGKDLHIGE